MNQSVYVVEMLRYGQRNNNSYIVGVYSEREKARQVGEAHKVWREGKYEYVIHSLCVDHIDAEVMEHYSHCLTDGCTQPTSGQS